MFEHEQKELNSKWDRDLKMMTMQKDDYRRRLIYITAISTRGVIRKLDIQVQRRTTHRLVSYWSRIARYVIMSPA